jgi:hypothetical protein
MGEGTAWLREEIRGELLILRSVLDDHLRLIGALTKAVTALAARVERLEGSQHKGDGK